MNYTLEEYLGIKVAKVRNSIKNEMEIALLPYEITTTQFVVLLKLSEKEANLFYSKLAPSLIFVVKEYKETIKIIKKEL